MNAANGRTVEFMTSEMGRNPAFPEVFILRFGTEAQAWYWSEEDGGFGVGPAAQFDYPDMYVWPNAVLAADAELSSAERREDYESCGERFIAHGTPTETVPVHETATYDGRVRAAEWPSDETVFSSLRIPYRGVLSTIADFGASGTDFSDKFSNLERGSPGKTHVGNSTSLNLT